MELNKIIKQTDELIEKFDEETKKIKNKNIKIIRNVFSNFNFHINNCINQYYEFNDMSNGEKNIYQNASEMIKDSLEYTYIIRNNFSNYVYNLDVIENKKEFIKDVLEYARLVNDYMNMFIIDTYDEILTTNEWLMLSAYRLNYLIEFGDELNEKYGLYESSTTLNVRFFN